MYKKQNINKLSSFAGIIILANLIMLSGCTNIFRQHLTTSEARLGAYSGLHEELVSLPEPSEKIVVAVYKFRDQTGQYKPSETGASWSTAVTQGATSILLQSLEESGWFVPIEREGLSNLLNERRIIRSSREQYQAETGEKQSMLPPLLFGGVMIEGGIISYETNVLTGGAGLRYFGTGASGEYREDKITIYLRAVSTSNGRILKTVHTSKTVLSQKLDAGVFRFVSLKKILEAEAGYTYNEPSQIAVQEAIDKAVFALVAEGIIDGLWNLKNPEDKTSKVLTDYLSEKENNYQTDYMGNVSGQRRKLFSVGAGITEMLYDGDYPDGKIMPGGSISLGYNENRPISFRLNTGLSKISTDNSFSNYTGYADIVAQFRMYNRFKASPYLLAGTGLLYGCQNYWFYDTPSFKTNIYPYVALGVGYEWLAGKRSGINISLLNYQFLNDRLDHVEQGKLFDRVWSAKIGYRYYFNLGSNKNQHTKK
jgi:curli production assembly/transport component CsgG